MFFGNTKICQPIHLGLQSDKNEDILIEYLCKLSGNVLLDSSSVFFDQKEMQNKVLEEIRTNMLCLIHYSKNHVFYRIITRNTTEAERSNKWLIN